MSFGEELRRERELRQISLREISNATKIDVRQLEALERNDFSCLPGGLYNRGYVRAYCEHIGVDSEDMVNAYLLEERAQAAPEGGSASNPGLLRGRPGANASMDQRAADARLATGRRRLVVLTLVAGLVVVAALTTWWVLAATELAARGSDSSSVEGRP